MKAPEVTESKKLKYTYPLGLGAFLMSGCYRATVIKQPKKQDEGFRKKRNVNINSKRDNFTESYCKRYIMEEKTKSCEVIT